MKRSHWVILLLLLAVVAAWLPGCVRIDGQRLSCYYDEAKNELRILLYYDGIHEYDSDPKGAEQIEQFARNGDILLLDWPFHLEMESVRQAIESPETNPQERELARLVTTFRVEPIGYYREPDGKLGAVQSIVIPEARQFVDKLNGIINDAVLAYEVGPDDATPKTTQRMRAAAEKNHAWITLDGQSVRVVLPVHPNEWDRERGRILKGFAEEAAEAWGRINGADADDAETAEKNLERKQNFEMLLGILASVPMSYVDRGDQIEWTIGRADAPTTIRAHVRDDYKPSLDQAVIEATKTDIDAQLADSLLDNTAEPAPPLADMLAFGPPEARVGALLAAARGDDSDRRTAAVKALKRWAEQWNETSGMPRAPAPSDEIDAYLDAWQTWYQQMKYYPLDPPASAPEEEEKEDS